MSKELVSIVPQISDYLCPVCFSLAYLPVRLDCKHIFCIRCVIKIQRRKDNQCPLCRCPVVMNATEGKFMLSHHSLREYVVLIRCPIR